MAQQEETTVKSLRRVLESTLDSRYAALSQLLQYGCLTSFANEMFSVTLISGEVKKQPEFDKIVGEFKAKMLFIDTQCKLEEHCYKLVMVLKKLGGPLIEAANVLEQSWVDAVWDQLKIHLTIMRPSQANDTPDPQNTKAYLQYLTQQQHRSSQSGYQPTITHRAPPPAEMPRSSYNMNNTLQRNPQLCEDIAIMVATILHQYRGQSNETLGTIYSQQVNQTTPPQPLPHHVSASPSALHTSSPQTVPSHHEVTDDYHYEESQQSTQDYSNGNSTWGFPRQPDHTSNGLTTQDDMVGPFSDTQSPWLSDPSIMARGSSVTHSGHYLPRTDGHSDTIAGSDIFSHIHSFLQQPSIPFSRSSTGDTMMPLQPQTLNQTHMHSDMSPTSPHLNKFSNTQFPASLNPKIPSPTENRHLEIRPHPLDLPLASNQISTDSYSHENEAGVRYRRRRTPSPGVSPLSESSGQDEEKNDQCVLSVNKRKHEMVINESTLPVTNTSELTQQEEIVQLRSRVSQLEMDCTNVKRDSHTRLSHLEEVHQKDITIATLQKELSEKSGQILELKIAFAITFFVLTALIFVAVLVRSSQPILLPPPSLPPNEK